MVAVHCGLELLEARRLNLGYGTVAGTFITAKRDSACELGSAQAQSAKGSVSFRGEFHIPCFSLPSAQFLFGQGARMRLYIANCKLTEKPDGKIAARAIFLEIFSRKNE